MKKIMVQFHATTNELVGFFEYFPMDGFKEADKGNFTIIVDPKRRRQGIGRKLLDKAFEMLPIPLNFEKQYYTSSGYKLIRSYLLSKGCKIIEEDSKR